MIRVRVPATVARLAASEIAVDGDFSDLGQLLAALERMHPGLGAALDSASINAAVNGEVVLCGRNATRLRDGDEVEFLVMFAGG